MVRHAQRRDAATSAARQVPQTAEAPRFKPIALPAIAAAFAIKRGGDRTKQRNLAELPAFLRDVAVSD